MITVENPTSQVDAAGSALPYWLDDADRAWIAQAASTPNTDNIPEFQVWPFEDPNSFGQPTLRGRCPLCGIVHEHGLGGGYVRRPHCSIQLPPFDIGTPKPDAYMLRPESSPAPESVAQAPVLAAKRVDLLQTLVRFPRTKTMVTLAGAKTRKRRWTSADFGVAVEALWSSGVCDERAAIMQVDGKIRPEVAYRNAVAEFIRVQGAGTMRARLRKAAVKAYKLAGQL